MKGCNRVRHLAIIREIIKDLLEISLIISDEVPKFLQNRFQFWNLFKSFIKQNPFICLLIPLVQNIPLNPAKSLNISLILCIPHNPLKATLIPLIHRCQTLVP
ncbi:unnamed protein product [Meloidogyne enterolobii]|uniref:Uncharacterized protein n=2 Tax=Meloidogyne enterolobii TaxID=390850 RepID=A0ACB0XWL4_MELEN